MVLHSLEKRVDRRHEKLLRRAHDKCQCTLKNSYAAYDLAEVHITPSTIFGVMGRGLKWQKKQMARL